MKIVLAIVSLLIVQITGLALYSQAQDAAGSASGTEPTRPVIYICAADPEMSCVLLALGDVMLCQVQCDEGREPGEFYFFDPAATVIEDGNNGQIRVDGNEMETRSQLVPRIFGDWPSTWSGNFWASSPAEKFLERGLGVPK